MPAIQIRLIKLPGDEGYSDIPSQETDGPPQVYKGSSLLKIKQKFKGTRVWAWHGTFQTKADGN